MNSWTIVPTIIIKNLGDRKYSWFLYLSPNRNKPTCSAPITFDEAFKCRESAREFAAKFKGPMRVLTRGSDDEVVYADGKPVIVDETKDRRKDKPVVTEVL